MKSCAYCGVSGVRLTKDHVIPKLLYPASKANSKVQRLTVRACEKCNNGWSDDEAHFRNVLMLCGEANQAVKELFSSSVIRGLRKEDGKRRVSDLWKMMQPVQTPTGDRHIIYPATDLRFIRILKKIVRGLHFKHQFGRLISDEMITAELLTFIVPQEFIKIAPIIHYETDIFNYQFFNFDDFDDMPMSFVWILTFFENKKFVAYVNKQVV